MPEFPSLIVKPGSYPCVIEHPDGQRLAAMLDLGEGLARERGGQVFDWPVPERGGTVTVPQPVEKISDAEVQHDHSRLIDGTAGLGP